MCLYRVYRNENSPSTQNDVADVWRDDLVTFARVCSFSFRTNGFAAKCRASAATIEGRPQRSLYKNVDSDATSLGVPSGKHGCIHGAIFKAAEAIRAIQITRDFLRPTALGTPGDPSLIGIAILGHRSTADAVFGSRMMKYLCSGLW